MVATLTVFTEIQTRAFKWSCLQHVFGCFQTIQSVSDLKFPPSQLGLATFAHPFKEGVVRVFEIRPNHTCVKKMLFYSGMHLKKGVVRVFEIRPNHTRVKNAFFLQWHVGNNLCFTYVCIISQCLFIS